VSSAGDTVAVIGIGNRWRRDDAVGFEVAARLRARGIDARDAQGEVAELIDLWGGAGTAIVIDAVTSGGVPGTVSRIEAGESRLPSGLSSASTHALGIAEAVELARTLGRLPERLVVLAIEGADFTAGEGLTPAVAAAVDEVVEAVVAELTRLTPAAPRGWRARPPRAGA
jgi:hydrogenase maturation protease